MVTSSVPRPAATVILTRLRKRKRLGGQDFEVYLVRRSPELQFLPGYYAFPGGAVEEEDYAPAMLARCRGLSVTEASLILGEAFNPFNLGYWISAVRELFEETGILLAVHANEKNFLPKEEKKEGLLTFYREKILQGEKKFYELLEKEDLYLFLKDLRYFGHWITPSSSPIRFDARFYLVNLISPQEPKPWAEEIISAGWFEPQAILAKSRAQKIKLAPPTARTLEVLAMFSTQENLFAQGIEQGPRLNQGIG